MEINHTISHIKDIITFETHNMIWHSLKVDWIVVIEFIC